MDEQQCDTNQPLIEEAKTTDGISENLEVPTPESQLETQSEAKTEAPQHNETKLPIQNHQNVQLVICPKCKNEVITITKLKPGLISYLCCCAMVCLLIPCCCVPFMCRPCLDTSHICPRCKTEIYSSGLLPM
ncbi:unnamed protein product [Blepharisma stoltei]|uniref:LITAF domain-containing protein n=1 Tax=Blepharisma stoltei TaxID=1481888 RepID=A0AAU9IQ24_9CILI|nr:unnamed protein product [Blepharisma stoltei]